MNDTITTPQAPSAPPPVKDGGAGLTPAQVVARLPKDATPAQQDSAIQANFKPGPVNWSKQPDTLHLPGHPVPKSIKDFDLQKLVNTSFFEGKPGYHPEIKGGRQGVAGDPIPYSIARDSTISTILLFCFVVAIVGFSQSARFIMLQFKTMFRQPSEKTTEISETASELRFLFFFVMQTCLLGALIGFFSMRDKIAANFTDDQHIAIVVFGIVILLYFLLRIALYQLTGWVFFDKKQTRQWMKFMLFSFSTIGVVLYPLVLLDAYFNLSVKTTLTCVAIIVILFKLLAFYKSFLIFFSKKAVYLQFFLYFCALEIVPLFAMLACLVVSGNYFK